ncbi:MAG: DEAD/DEAH box helicase [Candidatus Micrarchaeota archaeon]
MFFDSIGLNKEIADAVRAKGFVEPMPIQEKAIPLLLMGEDIIAQSKTGSGKTLAFGVPLMDTLTEEKHVQALVLAPVRELAMQVAQELRWMRPSMAARVAEVYGGVDLEPQGRACSHAAVVVGTPGRVLDLLNRKLMNLSHVRFVALDEADKMFEMGFVEDLDAIMAHTPREKQTALFSATISVEVENLASKEMRHPQIVRLSSDDDSISNIKQYYVSVDWREQLKALCFILDKEKPTLAMIFTKTRIAADKLSRRLASAGFKAEGIHGDLTQAQRTRIMGDFKAGKLHVLVATNVAARGLDIPEVTHVINYNLPEDHRAYTHRIGRTGRAEREGKAITIITSLYDQKELEGMAHRTGFELVRYPAEESEIAAYTVRGRAPEEHHEAPRPHGRFGGHGRAPHGGEHRPPVRGGRPPHRGSSGGRSGGFRRGPPRHHASGGTSRQSTHGY